MKKRPNVYVIAGPNGTGKTTFATEFLPKIAVNNLFKTYMDLADYCAIFDNSSSAPRLVFERLEGLDRIIKPETYDIIVEMLEERK